MSKTFRSSWRVVCCFFRHDKLGKDNSEEDKTQTQSNENEINGKKETERSLWATYVSKSPLAN